MLLSVEMYLTSSKLLPIYRTANRLITVKCIMKAVCIYNIYNFSNVKILLSSCHLLL